jgi:hypothetical protein
VHNRRISASWRNAHASIWAIASVGLFAALAAADAPTLSHLFPAGARRGSTVIITCHGEFSWPVRAWAPGVKVTVTEEKGELEVFIPRDLDADRTWLRLYNEEGASTAVPFLIGSLPETTELEPNDAPDSPQKLSDFAPPPGDAEVTINGVLRKNDDVDGFAVTLTAGQTLIAAVAANTAFDSPMDSILQVVLPDGTIVAENHDDIGLDPRIVFIARETGTYVVRLFAFPAQPDQRIQFRGGDKYVYRLTLTTGPYITHAVPLTVTQEGPEIFEPSTVEVLGWNIPRGTRLPVVLLGQSMRNDLTEVEPNGTAEGPGSRIGFVRAPGWAGGSRVRLVPHRVTPVWANTTQEQPLSLSPPDAVSGCIRAPKCQDFFRLSLRKDQEVVIAVESLSLDSRLVPLVRLRDPQGNVVAEVPETGGVKDADLTHKPADDGDYLLAVGDRFRHGGSRYFYRLTVLPRETGFELALDTDAMVLTPDKPLEIPITINRYAALGETLGDIKIEAIDLPAGVTSMAVISEAMGDTSGKVTLKLETTGQSCSGPIRIRGTSDALKMERLAYPPAKFRTSFDRVWLTVTGPRVEESSSGN